MPTYEYTCGKCGHTFEQFQSITAKALRKCPACDKAALKRLIGSGAGIIFKGSGFYQTDYRSDHYLKAQKNETAPTDKAADKKPEIKSKAKDSKPASPAKSKSSSQD